MGLRILHTADWHLDSPFTSLTAPQRQQLCQIQRKLPAQVAQVCRREGCDMVLIGGDVFDGPPSRETVEAVKKAFRDCAVPVFVAPGNHDFCGPGSPWLEEGWPENVHIFTGGLEAVVLPELSCRIYGAGYRSMDCPALLEGFRAEGEERYCIGLLHGDPTSSRSPYCPVTAAQVRDSGLDYLALGHVHKAGAFRSGSTLCAWPGSPMGRGWDETGEKGLAIVTLEERADLQVVPLDTVCFYEETLDVNGGTPEAILPAVETGDFYRITLQGTGPVDLEALGKQFPHIPNLEFRDETTPPIDPWAGMEEDSLRGAYFRLLNTSEEGETARLAAEISQALLAGREVALP